MAASFVQQFRDLKEQRDERRDLGGFGLDYEDEKVNRKREWRHEIGFI